MDVNSNEAADWSEIMRLKSENEHLRAELREREREARSGQAALLIVGELCAQIPIPETLKATGTAQELIDWFKRKLAGNGEERKS